MGCDNIMYKFLYSSLLIYSLISCSKQVKRVDTERVIDLSGRFNDTDSQQIAKSMISQIIDECRDFNVQPSRNIVLAVGQIRNLSHEHINAETFINDIERVLINRQVCRIVANKSIREAIKEEMSDLEDINIYDEKSQCKAAARLGVNRIIFGSINSIIDKEKNKEVKFYQVDLKLIDPVTNEIRWIGSHKIKKYIKD